MHEWTKAANRPIILLGADVSKDAGVPTSCEMTETLVDSISNNRHYYSHSSSLSSVVNFVCSALIAQDGAAGENPYKGLDVERVFSAIRLLADRREVELSPFAFTWHLPQSEQKRIMFSNETW